MGVIIGLILGMVIGFVVETFDTSLGAIEDVEETLGTQVLGIIPQADAKDVWEGLKDKYPEGNKEHASEEVVNLISHFVPKSMMAESFRALRTNIQFKDAEKKTETIAVTSSSPEEGKTLVAINLAITMAQAGMKVLLVGSDLRKPVIGRVFGVEMTPGLTDVLLGNYPWRDTVKSVTDIIMGKMTPDEVMMTPGLDNLHIITSGPIPPNPAELIESGRLTDFTEEAKEDYDMIIFDTSPILSTADAAILGAKVDGVLLVYRVGTVSRGLLRRSTAQLTQVQCNVLGVVLNGMRPELSPDFQDYKYYTYYYSYGEGEKRRKDRGRIKGFSFLRRKGDSQRKEEEKISIGVEGERLPKKRAKKLNRGRLALMLVAIGFLAAGLLWQSGIIDPFKRLGMETPAKKDQVKPAGKKEHAKKVVQSKPKTVSPKPKPTVSEEKPQPRVKTPIIKPTPVKKQLAVIKTPVVKKEPSRPAVTTKPKRVSTKPETHVSVEKSRIDVKTPVAQSKTRIKHKGDLEAPTSSEEIPSFPYSVLLSHCRSVRHAEEVVSRYRNRGLAPYWVKVELSNGIWYRVFVGHFEDRERAEKFRQEHGLQEAVVKKTQYANFINTYGPSDELKDWIESLRRIGYSPYVIEDLSGKSRLFLGAFITKEGAEKQYHDLKSKGIESQVVKR